MREIRNRSMSPFRYPRMTYSIILGLTGAAALAAGGSSTGGWRAQQYPQVRAVRAVRISSQAAHSGRHSLALLIDLDGRLRPLREGEAYVDLRFNPPADETVPANLASHAVTAWFYAPAGLAGPLHNPNGVRLFVKDSQWRSEYGPWTHIRGGGWTRLSIVPSTVTPPTGFRTPGFDPQQVLLMGVSVAVGGGSTTRCTGAAYLDDVAWGSGVKYGFEP